MLTPPPPTASPPTYVVELTPPGRAAVAVVLVAGPNAIRAVNHYFKAHSGRSIVEVPFGRIVVGRWGGPTGEELVVCRHSEEEIEIHCHGGIAAVRAVIEALVAHGCQMLTWQDWLQRPRSRVCPKLESASAAADATTWAAHIALASATTARTAAILLDQLNGALSMSIHAALESIAAVDWQHAAKLIDELLQRREVGLHLTSPWRVVFAGAPNVGKSSLINALAGYERAIVAPTPGTTRDVVTLTTAIDGWPVELADTAGLRTTCDELEAAGVQLAEGALAGADLAVIVEDATDLRRDEDRELPRLPSRVIRVRNKIDLVLNASAAAGVADDRTHGFLVNTSALTGEGIAELAATIGESLVPNPPALGDAVPFTAQQVEALAVARSAIKRQHAVAATEALQSLLAAALRLEG